MIEIIPAIDIIDGQCVRLTKGDYNQKSKYYDDPLEIALKFRDAGLKRLHVVDLDGAKSSAPANLKVLERLASKTGLDIQYGGGIKNAEAIKAVFGSGANRAICGSIAITRPDMFVSWLGEFGTEHIILGADIKDGVIATHGWLESSGSTAEGLIGKFIPDGLSQVICTDISCDGTLNGPNFSLYEALQRQFPVINITISGGISCMDDIKRLDGYGMKSVIVGKAIYENRISLKELSDFIGNKRPD